QALPRASAEATGGIRAAAAVLGDRETAILVDAALLAKAPLAGQPGDADALTLETVREADSLASSTLAEVLWALADLGRQPRALLDRLRSQSPSGWYDALAADLIVGGDRAMI